MGLFDRRKRIEVLENEIRSYQMYIKPLEELVREIRARQHEFDNHMNAILNMHYMIDNYDELVKAQSEYIKEMYTEDSRQLIALLKISDKILAGFLYSKILSAKSYLNIDLEVKSLDIISSISEHSLIEIIGTLVDNAFEAANEELPNIKIVLASSHNKIIFEISNEAKNLTLEQVSKFFEKGYSTKNDNRASKFENKHGVGLYNARRLSQKYGGDLTVALDYEEDKQIITFRAEL
jgi:sensor histidine kinase regulating citrate/malate metabolism